VYNQGSLPNILDVGCYSHTLDTLSWWKGHLQDLPCWSSAAWDVVHHEFVEFCSIIGYFVEKSKQC